MKPSGFNPKARWDRHIPEDADASQQELLDEKIKVLAFFNSGKILPRLFIWRDKKYRVRATTYAWQERQGAETINRFSVYTGSDLYQLSFSNTTYGWRLDKILT